jgi:hypothetical protein
MMRMNTQFGDMVITDDNKTLVSDELKKEIEDKKVRGTRAEMDILDEAANPLKDMDK